MQNSIEEAEGRVGRPTGHRDLPHRREVLQALKTRERQRWRRW